VQVCARRRILRQGRAAPPHRAPPGGDARRPQRRVRHLRARRLTCDIANEDSLANLERLAMRRRALARRGRAVRQELDKLGEEPAAFVDLGPAPRADLRDPARGRRRTRSRATGACSASTRRTSAAISSLDRLFVLTERWTELVPCSPARRRSQSARRALELQVPPRPGAPDPPQRPDVGHRRLPRGAQRGAGSPSHARGARRPLRRGVTSSRSARSSSRSTKPQGSGTSSPPCSRPSSRTSRARERLAMYYRIAELQEEKLISHRRRARRLHPRR
jgi:hypothetical protein